MREYRGGGAFFFWELACPVLRIVRRAIRSAAKTVNKLSYSDVSHVKVEKWLTATG